MVLYVVHVPRTMQDQPNSVSIKIMPTHNMQNSKLRLRVSRTFKRFSERFRSTPELFNGSSINNRLLGDRFAS